MVEVKQEQFFESDHRDFMYIDCKPEQNELQEIKRELEIFYDFNDVRVTLLPEVKPEIEELNCVLEPQSPEFFDGFHPLKYYYVQDYMHNDLVVGQTTYLKQATLRTPKIEKHVQTTRTRNASLRCIVCKQEFVQAGLLKEHMKIDHERRYQCPDENCGYSGKIPSRLKEHMICHSDLKPFECEWCDHSFRRRSDLNVHIKRRHPEFYDEI